MIQKIRIQNFSSIQDATVELGKVNLFIGPNNSGKSNMLKGIELMGQYIYAYPNGKSYKDVIIDSNCFRTNASELFINKIIDFDILISDSGYENPLAIRINEEELLYTLINENGDFTFNSVNSSPYFLTIKNHFKEVFIHKIDPSKYEFSSYINTQIKLNSDGSNIVSFLFHLSQNYKKRFQQLEADLAACVVDLVSLSTPADPNEPGKLKLKFFDTQDRAFWAEEVSEGVLYFLALLCIVHQPDPPKLLLLEEPEKGIHPRRIREVMNFIFQLAEERDIQIIMTSHSPYVVDHFADIPECISVFDKEDGATIIRNAARDILEPLNKRNAEQNLPPVQYTDSLGEHWVSGFLGGVPL